MEAWKVSCHFPRDISQRLFNANSLAVAIYQLYLELRERIHIKSILSNLHFIHEDELYGLTYQ